MIAHTANKESKMLPTELQLEIYLIIGCFVTVVAMHLVNKTEPGDNKVFSLSIEDLTGHDVGLFIAAFVLSTLAWPLVAAMLITAVSGVAIKNLVLDPLAEWLNKRFTS